MKKEKQDKKEKISIRALLILTPETNRIIRLYQLKHNISLKNKAINEIILAYNKLQKIHDK